MTTLVTGSEGFIGGHVIKRLQDPVRYDIEIDRDIREGISVEREVEKVIHLAADSSVWGSPESLMSHNIEGTREVVRFAREEGAKIVFASSMAVYSASNPYARSKIIAENMIDKSRAESDIYRLANVIGEGLPEGHGQVGTLVEEAQKGKIETWGFGEIERSFADVEEVARILLEGSEHRDIACWNATNGEIAELIADKADRDVDIKPVRGEEIPSKITVEAEVQSDRSLGEAVEDCLI